MNRVRASMLAVAAAMLALLSACGNGPPSTSGSGGSGGGSIGTAGANVGTATVKVSAGDDLKFTPASTTAKVGDIVQWTNSGTVQHNITFNDPNGASVDDTTFAPGNVWQVKFTKAGTYNYQCTIHPGMTGIITVS